MIRSLFYSICCLIILATQVNAQNIIFPDELLSEIRVIETNQEEGKAVITDGDGNETEISLNDVISIDEVVVVEIEPGHITVKKDNTKTRMLVVPGFE
jgi:hypothetical protein